MNSSVITIIGGGISGLTTAWWLHRQGISVTLFEREAETGGTMKTIRKDGWMIETGPNSALETTPLFQQLFSDLGIADQCVYASPAGKNRYILRNGTLHSLPLSPGAFFRTSLWSLPGKLRLMKEPFIGKAEKEETIAEFVERRLGRELLDYAINPFVAGVFAGAPEKLSVRAAFPKLYALEEKYGGLIRGQLAGARERKKRREVAKDRAEMFSFLNGMQTLPDALRTSLGEIVRTSVHVTEVTYDAAQKVYTVRYSEQGTVQEHQSEVLLFAVPADISAKFVEPFDAQLSEAIKNIYYPPVAEVFLGYKSDQIGRVLDGFGFLIPEKERRNILGAIWTSALFEGRAPKGHSAVTVFVGGSRQPDQARLDDNALVKSVTKELNELMNISGEPVMTHITRWEKAIPQYQLGHLSLMQKIEAFEAAHPGMFLSGNFRGGISVGDCVIQSETMSQTIVRFLEQLKN